MPALACSLHMPASLLYVPICHPHTVCRVSIRNVTLARRRLRLYLKPEVSCTCLNGLTSIPAHNSHAGQILFLPSWAQAMLSIRLAWERQAMPFSAMQLAYIGSNSRGYGFEISQDLG